MNRSQGGNPPLPWSAEAARDRLSSTTFLVALLHGVLILGITFGAAPAGDRDVSSSLEVVLVTSEAKDREPPPSAVLLAQQNLTGSGNAAPDESLRTTLGALLPADLLGPLQAGGTESARPGTARSAEPVLVTAQSRLFAPPPGEPLTARDQRSTVPGAERPIELVGRLSDTNVVPDDRPRELLISANTRESRIAGYLTHWKRRVEQVGTLNYPRAAGAGHRSRNPILEVAIRADGSLKEATVMTSSGQEGLDRAALDILRMSAPFEPFPETLRGDYDVLRFAYEWRFSESTATVRTAAGS